VRALIGVVVQDQLEEDEQQRDPASDIRRVEVRLVAIVAVAKHEVGGHVTDRSRDGEQQEVEDVRSEFVLHLIQIACEIQDDDYDGVHDRNDHGSLHAHTPFNNTEFGKL
jgi:hypothetical protein